MFLQEQLRNDPGKIKAFDNNQAYKSILRTRLLKKTEWGPRVKQNLSFSKIPGLYFTTTFFFNTQRWKRTGTQEKANVVEFCPLINVPHPLPQLKLGLQVWGNPSAKASSCCLRRLLKHEIEFIAYCEQLRPSKSASKLLYSVMTAKIGEVWWKHIGGAVTQTCWGGCVIAISFWKK